MATPQVARFAFEQAAEPRHRRPRRVEVTGLANRHLPSFHLARLTTTCPPAVTASGAGCPSSGGANVLAAVTLPWVESTLHTRGTGLPTSALVIAATGFASLVPGFPLDTVFAQALPGCLLHVDPMIQQLHLTSTGVADSLLPLPATPPLVGVAFHQQMVVLEIDASLAIVALTTTNSLQFVAGDF